jgi:hypothetical protein
VPDIPAVCGGLWSNLRRFTECHALAGTSCGQGSKGAGHMHWQLNISLLCNAGMVHSAWWEATRNKWGAIDCNAGAN